MEEAARTWLRASLAFKHPPLALTRRRLVRAATARRLERDWEHQEAARLVAEYLHPEKVSHGD